jgi:hypothetical protein
MTSWISQGRLSAQSGHALQRVDVINSTTIFYSAYKGNLVNIGGVMYPLVGGQSIVLGDYFNTNGAIAPPYGNIYGIFWILDAGGNPTMALEPSWGTPPNIGLSNGVESAAGATDVYYPFGGITVNVNPAPMLCKYGPGSGTSVLVPQYNATMVGLVCSLGNGYYNAQISPAGVPGGSAPFMGLSNLDWPEEVQIFECDSISSYIAGNPGYIAAGNSWNNRITYLACRNAKQITSRYDASIGWRSSGAEALTIGIGWNQASNTPTFTGAAGHGAVLGQGAVSANGQGNMLFGEYSAFPEYGLNNVVAILQSTLVPIEVLPDDFSALVARIYY